MKKNQHESLFSIGLFVIDNDGKFEKLEDIQINNIPLIGHYYKDVSKHKLYHIKDIIQTGTSIYIILFEVDASHPYLPGLHDIH